MSIKKLFCVFLCMKVMTGASEDIALSVIMLRFQYSLKLSFSSTYSVDVSCSHAAVLR